jgi:hypothetical protein
VPRRLGVAGVEDIAAREATLCGRLHGGRVICAPSDRCGPRHTAPAPAPKPSKPAKPAAVAPKPAAVAPKPAAVAPKPGKPIAKPGKPPPGRPTTEPAAEPTGEPGDALGFTTARSLAFDLGFCVVTTANALQCGDGCRQLDPVKLERVDSVVGRCALLRSRTVTCFDEVKGVAVPGVTRATLLAAGRAHACAFVDGRIACWGDDSHGQLGGFAIAR